MIFYKDVETNRFVIPGLNYHMRRGAQQRLQHVLDDGDYQKVQCRRWRKTR
jgi:acetyl-CoA carboxylase carboxyl transferase subunit beta